MNELDEKMDALTKKLISERGKRHPFTGHPLCEQDDYIRNLYFQIVCAALSYQNNADEPQLLFLDRLLTGAKAEHDAQTYFRKALEIDSTVISNLVEALNNTNTLELKLSLALDLLLICHLKTCTDGQAEFLAELFDVMRITKKQIEQMISLARSMIMLDNTELQKVARLLSLKIKRPYFRHYTELLGEDAAGEFERDALVKIANGVDFDTEIVNMKIDSQIIKRINNGFAFGKKIVFVNCEFSCDEPVRFNTFETVEFKNCQFHDFDTETIILDDVMIADFYDCSFINCIKQYESSLGDWRELGGVIKCLKGTKTRIIIRSCEFTNCGGNNRAYYFRSSIISDGLIEECENNTFKDCWHRNGDEDMDPDDPRRVLFSHVEKYSGNIIIGSSKLCP